MFQQLHKIFLSCIKLTRQNILSFCANNLLLFSLLITLSFPSVISAQTSFWIQRGGSNAVDEGYDISIDGSGNVYTTGHFNGTVTFGSLSGTKATISSTGNSDIFVCKLNNVGVVQWAVKAGGSGPDKGQAIKVDAQGNSYVTGYFYGNATFGSTSISAANGSQDAFIAKYNSSGVLQWVTAVGGNNGDIGNGINIDKSGNVIVTGQFMGTAQFGSFSLTSMVNPSTSASSWDIFTAKLNASGTVLWVEQGKAPYTDRGIDVVTDASDNIYVTGQFSDTITFDNVLNNNMYNAIFIIKYNSSGVEQWVRRAGGGTQNISYGIAIDNSSNIYITGDFKDNLLFIGTPNTNLSNTYSNCAFVAKYNTGGDLQWGKSLGSESFISSRNIAVDNAGNAYIVGNFECTLTEMADVYGKGVFNSIGFQDIFVAKFYTNGTRHWVRHLGGQQNDYGSSIALNSSAQPHITGYFNSRISFPASNVLTTYNLYPTQSNSYGPNGSTYCSDTRYNSFYSMEAIGNSDIFISNAIDLSREPYDYYYRTGSGCIRDFVEGCINNTGSETLCPDDSVRVCGSTNIYAATKTAYASYYVGRVGPNFSYKWSTGSTSKNINVTSTGYYSVTMTTEDKCYTSSDTIYATVDPIPATPTITNVGPLTFCAPDSVMLIGGNYGSNTYRWTNPSSTNDTVVVKNSGYYTFEVTNSYGCKANRSVYVSAQTSPPIDSIAPKIKIVEDTDGNDSISFCAGQYFRGYVYDTIKNPTGTFQCISNSSTSWSVSPSMSNYNYSCSGLYERFNPTASGTYTLTATTTLTPGTCANGNTMVFTSTKDIYVEVIPMPVVNNSVSGNLNICDGGSTVLISDSSGYTNQWYGPSGGIAGSSTLDTVVVTMPGQYRLRSTKTVQGCTAYQDYYKNVTYKTSPTVTMNPSYGVVCPNDSVTLTASGGVSYQWQGPSGSIGGNTQSIKVSTPGYYFVYVTDATNCQLSSNTLEVKQYNTPFVEATSAPVVCGGNSVDIMVVTNAGSTIQWLSPLSGSQTTKTISAPGAYTARVTSCGIVTDASITITGSGAIAQITPDGPLTFCAGDSVVLSGNPGMVDYEWNPGGIHKLDLVVKQSGTYTLTTIDGANCTVTSSPVTTSLMPDTLSAPVSQDVTICPNNTATLNASASMEIRWYDSDNILIDSLTSSITTPPLADTTRFYVENSYSTCTRPRTVIKINFDTISPPVSQGATICPNDSVTLNATASNNIRWYDSETSIIPLDSGGSFTTPPLTGTTTYYIENYYLTCKSERTAVTVTIFSSSSIEISFDPSSGCPPISVQFNNNSSPSTNLSYLWDFGDDSTSTEQNPIHEYIQAGTYDISYTITDANAQCDNTITIDSLKAITVHTLPKADFSLNPPVTDIISPDVQVIDNSIGGVSCEYLLVDSIISNRCDPTVFFSDTGSFVITQIITNANGCSDTTYANIRINTVDLFWIPNAFSPNGDGRNDVFGPIHEGVLGYELLIFNRWGELIFRTDDQNEGWDGTSKGSTKIAPQGVYVYKLSYTSIVKEEDHVLIGRVTLLK